MKKSDIINEYNSLTEQLKAELETYKSVTGEDFPGHINTGNMDSSFMLWSKDELEQKLCMRKSSIYSIREKIENYDNMKNLESTVEGRMFIESLSDRKAELEKEIDGVSERMHDSFGSLLESIGLEGWGMCPVDVRKTVPSFRWTSFDIYKIGKRNEVSVGYPHISIYIEYKNGKWEMKLNSATSGGETITDFGDEYWRFKAYVTICDHSREMREWMDSVYDDMAHKAYDLQSELEKVKEDIDNPYGAWTRTH